MILTYIALGSNLGSRLQNFELAGQKISALPATVILRKSRNYETEPRGGPAGQEKYWNAVWEVKTNLAPGTLIEQLLRIEAEAGRIRSEKNAPRTLDLDLLFYGDRVIQSPGLSVPHPRLEERGFVLAPLMDLAPEMIHPVLKKTVRDLWQIVSKEGIVPLL